MNLTVIQTRPKRTPARFSMENQNGEVKAGTWENGASQLTDSRVVRELFKRYQSDERRTMVWSTFGALSEEIFNSPRIAWQSFCKAVGI